VIGYGGCAARGQAWNVGYRFSPHAHGRGYAAELATEAMRQARAADSTRPIIARLLEHNRASERIAVKLGITLVYRGLDEGNPDPSAVRLIYPDRPLTPEQLADLAP
jgi:RimJ/RimL family protein N-acetyltransferase